MTKDEALKLALEALESVLANHNGAPVLPWIEARDAIKQVLAASVVPDFTEANEETSRQIQSINRAIGVGQRKVTGNVITRKLIYPHRGNT